MHRLPAHVKLVALVGFVLVVVATPVSSSWVFGVYLGQLVAVVVIAGLPARRLAGGMLIEVPFILFALLIPFVATGPRVEVGPLQLSQAGLVAGWSLLARGTLGVLASLVVAGTTRPADVVAGLERLRLPDQLVQILTFMLRYLDVVGAEMGRMRIARESRGFAAHSVRHWPVLAASAGALFIRSYERGERVHLAMLSRGYTGTFPRAHEVAASRSEWLTGLSVPALALVTLVGAAL